MHKDHKERLAPPALQDPLVLWERQVCKALKDLKDCKVSRACQGQQVIQAR